ncbi:MAG TPA: hypothetical protein VIU12_35290 [Chryseolinea sp.]
MQVELIEVEKEDFANVDCEILFANVLADRKHVMLSKGEDPKYKFTWQSDLIKPELTEIADDVFSIGIDLNFAIVNIETRNVLLNVSLDSFFYYTTTLGDSIYVIAEVEIMKIDKHSYVIIHRYGLPDIFEEMKVVNDRIEVKCFGEQTVYID